MKARRIKFADGTVKEMTYDEVCEALNIIARINFVKITNSGTIGFTAGKPDEIRYLLSQVESVGMIPSKKLVDVKSH